MVFLCVDSAISIALVVMRPAMLHLPPGVCASKCSPHLHLYGSYLLKNFWLSIVTMGVLGIRAVSVVVSCELVLVSSVGVGEGDLGVAEA